VTSEFIALLPVIQFPAKDSRNQKNLIDLGRDTESQFLDMDSCCIPCLIKLFQTDKCFQQLSERSCIYEICLSGFYDDKNRAYLGYKILTGELT